MVSKKIVLGIPTLLAGFSLTALSNTYHPLGKEFVDRCKEVVNLSENKKSDKTHTAWCVGYMQGILDSNLFFNVFRATRDQGYHDKATESEFVTLLNKHKLFCIPQAMKLGQIIQKIVVFGQQNPKYLPKKASLMVYLGMKKNFSCPRNQ